MPRPPGSWNDIRGRGFFLAIAMALVSSLVSWGVYTHLTAKIPGETHCYKEVCHRVFTLEETRRQVGQTVDLLTTHYDAPGIDKFNTGQYTSSGEEFDAGNPARTSASNFPDGTELLIWHPVTQRASHVRVNDFGPFWGKRTLDVTRRVAEDLGFAKDGVTTLKVTVIWAPPPSDPRYRKGRVYPPSLGLLGVVDSTQHAAVVQRLIATAHKRNGFKGPPVPDEPDEPPGFYAEPAEVARERERQLDRDTSMIVAGLPRLVLDSRLPDELVPVLIADGPPGFRSEAATVAVVDAAAEQAAVARLLRTLPAPELPTAAPEIPALPVGAEISAASQPAVAVSSASTVAIAGVSGPNNSNQPTMPLQDASVGVPARVAEIATTAPVPAEAIVIPAGPAVQDSSAPSVSLSVATAHASGWKSLAASPYLWLGMVLMLSTLWGTASRSRNRGGAEPVTVPASMAGASPAMLPASTARMFDNDPLATAKRASAQAEHDAREALARALATGNNASADEQLARDQLAHELARREAEMDVLRARLKAAEAPPVVDVQAAPVGPAPQDEQQTIRDARARQLAAVETLRLERDAQERRARESRLAAMPSTLPRDLAAAVLDLPEASGYWGNVLIAQARLQGTVKSGSALRIDGVVDGSCEAPVVMISAGAVITGVVAAEHVVVLGAVYGTIIGKSVTIAKSAVVEGDMFYQVLSLDQDAQCDVRFSRLAADATPSAVAADIASGTGIQRAA